MLASAKDLYDIAEIRDIATAARAYAKAAQLGIEATNHAAEIKIRAERKAGEYLQQLERGSGERTDLQPRPSVGQGSDYAATLTDVGIARSTAHRWQKSAEIPEPVFEEHIATVKEARQELTSAGVLRLAKEQGRAKKRRRAKEETPKKVNIPNVPTLIHGRAENCPEIADSSIDLIITSPPYNLGTDRWPMGGGGRTAWDGGIGYDSLSDEMTPAQYVAWQADVFAEMWRVAKDGASFFYNHKTRTQNGVLIHPMGWIPTACGEWTIRQEIVWDRTSTHNHSATLFWPEDERIYWLTKGRPTVNGTIGMSTVWRFHGPTPNTWHPAPFSEELPERCIRAIGLTSGVVLDPFSGSGTTLAVASMHGLCSIGIDISADYIKETKRVRGW
jgi:modification methylase